MTQSATAKKEEQNSAFGVPYHEESCQADQPMKRGRGRPRKNIIPPKTTPIINPTHKSPIHPNTFYQRNAEPLNNCAHQTQRRDSTPRHNYPNTRSTRSQAQWRPQYSPNPIQHPDYRNTYEPAIPRRDVTDLPVTRNSNGQLVYQIPVDPSITTPYHSYNQQQHRTSHRDETNLTRYVPRDRAYSEQTRYNLRRRF